MVVGCTASGLEAGLEAVPGSVGGKRLGNGGVLERLEVLGRKGVLQAAC